MCTSGSRPDLPTSTANRVTRKQVLIWDSGLGFQRTQPHLGTVQSANSRSPGVGSPPHSRSASRSRSEATLSRIRYIGLKVRIVDQILDAVDAHRGPLR